MEDRKNVDILLKFLDTAIGDRIILNVCRVTMNGLLVSFKNGLIILNDVIVFFPDSPSTIMILAISINIKSVMAWGKSADTTVIRNTVDGTASLAGMNKGKITTMLSVNNVEQSDDYNVISNYAVNLGTVRADVLPQIVDLDAKVDKEDLSAKERGQMYADHITRQEERDFKSKGLPRTTATQLIRQPPPIYVGTQLQFWVKDTPTTQVQIWATCVKVSRHGYLFIQNSVPRQLLTDAVVNDYAAVWDNNIYPNVRDTFGDDRDTDGYNKIFIIFTPFLNLWGAAGLFRGADKLPDSWTWANWHTHSNEKDMFYVEIPSEASDIEYDKGTLAHEFQHMINWDARTDDPYAEWTWLNEAFSELAEFITGFGHTSYNFIRRYLATPFSLTCWGGLSVQGRNYGGSALFGCYLYEQFGSAAIKKMVANVYHYGIGNIENIAGKNFNTIYNNWVTALCLSNTGLSSDYRYNYRMINLRRNEFEGLIVLDTLDIGGSAVYTPIKPYQPIRVLLINPGSSSTITVTSDASAVGAVVITSLIT